MELVYIIMMIVFIVYLIKISMRWIYNYCFYMLKSPNLFLISSFLFNIVVLEILNLLVSINIKENIFNLYCLSSIIAIWFLIPPKNITYTEEEFNKICDDFSGIKNSRKLYRIGLFLFFLGGIVGAYIIMMQNGITIIEHVK